MTWLWDHTPEDILSKNARRDLGLAVNFEQVHLVILTGYLCWLADEHGLIAPEHRRTGAQIAMDLGLGTSAADDNGYALMGQEIREWMQSLQYIGIVSWDRGLRVDFQQVRRFASGPRVSVPVRR